MHFTPLDILYQYVQKHRSRDVTEQATVPSEMVY